MLEMSWFLVKKMMVFSKILCFLVKNQIKIITFHKNHMMTSSEKDIQNYLSTQNRYNSCKHTLHDYYQSLSYLQVITKEKEMRGKI